MRTQNFWHVLNLRESPFFQDPLGVGDHPYPIDLFVGRETEADLVLRGIGAAPHTRHVVHGAPGVGKTTLVQYIKTVAMKEGYLAAMDAIPVTSAATADDLRLALLGTLYDVLVAWRPGLAGKRVLQDVSQLLNVARTRSLNLSVGHPAIGSAGLGMGSARTVGPGALEAQSLPLLRDLCGLAAEGLGKKGIILHLNNLENLSEADQAQAARVVRDLRDTGLMFAPLHTLIVGTDDAVRAVITGQEQLRSVVSGPGCLVPLSALEVKQLLNKRYLGLRADPDQPAEQPVKAAAVDALYAVFNGNLRGTLHALDEAAKVLIGRGPDPTAAMDLERMRPVLHEIYRSKAHSELTNAQVLYLADIVGDEGAEITQRALVDRWEVSQPYVHTLLGDLVRAGYVAEAAGAVARGRGRPRQYYTLTGPARLAFGDPLGTGTAESSGTAAASGEVG